VKKAEIGPFPEYFSLKNCIRRMKLNSAIFALIELSWHWG